MALANITNNILTDSGILVTNLTPTSRTITINGTTYDLSADRSWTIATGVGGSGTTNYLPKFTGTSTIGNSIVQDNSTHIDIGGYALFTRAGKQTIINPNVGAGNVVADFGVGSGMGLTFTTDVERMRLTASGNLGLGVTPSAWNSPFKAMQIGSTTAVWDISSVSGFSNNLYNDGTGRYLTSDFATIFQQWDGGFAWLQAPSGTAGNAISFTQAMTLDASGRLGIGTTSPTEKLHVAGNIKVTIGDIDVDSSTSYIRANNTRIAGTDRKIQVWNNVSAYIDVLTMAATGAATFSSSVTAGAFIPSYNTSYFGTDGTISNYSATNYMYVNGTGGLRLKAEGVGYQKIVLEGGTSNDIWLTTANTERMRITSSGILLVGTTTEGFLGKLQVAGSVAITGQYNTVLPSSSFSYFDGSGQVVSSSSSASALYLDTTWNTTGNPDGIYLNVTNTASGASSKLLNLKVGSVSQFSVSKAGAIQTSAPSVGSAQPWKLGSYAAGGTGTATGVIYIEVNGQIYSIPALLGTP